MRVEQLDLLAYGHFQGATLDLSRPAGGLTVVLGPNEAGKSTTRRALVAALFGFPTPAADDFRHGRRGLRVGARLRSSAGEELAFVRQGVSSAPLVGPGGEPVEEALLRRLCGGAGRDLFTRMFSVDHHELRTASEQLLAADGEIGRLVFGAGLGGGSVAQVLERLEAQAEDLFRPRGRNQPVAAGLRSYREAMARAREARVRASEWDGLRREAREADTAAATVRQSLTEARTERSRVARLLAVLPDVAERRNLRERLEQLAREGPLPTADWAQRTGQALAGHATARGQLEAAESARRDVARRLEATAAPGPVLHLADTVDGLTRDLGRYDQAVKDMGARQVDLGEARGELARLLSVLGAGGDADRPVAETALTAVEELAAQRTELETRKETAARELATLDAEIASLRRVFQGMGETPAVDGLARALEVAVPMLESARTAPERRAALERDRQGIVAAARRLGLDGSDVAGLEGLAVPTAAAIADELGRRRVAAGRDAELEARVTELEGELEALARRTEELRTKPGLPDPGELAAAREHREEGWSLVRGLLEGPAPEPDVVARWSDGMPLPRAYEEAVAGADRAADTRLAHAQDVTDLAQLERQGRELGAQLASVREDRQELGRREEAARQGWQERWRGVGLATGEPEAMAQWREDFTDLLGLAATAQDQEARLAAEEQAAAALAGELAGELRKLGVEPGSTRLDLLAAQGRQAVDRAQEDEGARSTAVAALERAEQQRPGRQMEVERLASALATWEEEWREALVPLGLDGGTRPKAALRAVQVHRELPAARKAVADLERRIAGMDRDRRDFTLRAQQAAGDLAGAGAPLGDPDRTARLVVEELTALLEQARRSAAAREALEGQGEEVDHRVAAARETVAATEVVLAALREEAGLPAAPDPVDGLAAAVARAEEAATCRTRLDAAEGRLLAQGGGRALEEVVREAGAPDVDADRLAARAAELDRQIEALEPELTAAERRVGQATGALNLVNQEGRAADMEQQAQEDLAQAAAAAGEYARTAMAAFVLRRAVTRYGERHRGPILERAGHLLGVLTQGAFSGLVPDVDGDRQVLLARRRNGELCTTGSLSDGARDQLYLALRLAGIEHQLDQLAEPLPVVLDDLLVNFDDDRARAGLAALGELAARTQVLLFTHHQRVGETAVSVLGAERAAVVRLAARDHDTALGDTAGGAAGGVGEREAVLGALARAGGPCGKAELLEASGIDPARWSAVIGALVDGGLVVRQGQKRGARYSLAR